MTILDRILLILFTLLVAAISVAAVAAGLNLIPYDVAAQALTQVYTQYNYAIPWIAGFIFVFLLSLRFLFWRDRRNRRFPSIDQRTDYGDVKISIETIEKLALQSVHRFRGIRDVKTRVRVEEGGLTVDVKLNIEGNRSIPELSEEIQQSVHQHVGDTTGIPVAKVTVYITSVVASGLSRQRVE